MSMQQFSELFGNEVPLIGMIHLPPLPGSPRFDGSLENLNSCLNEAKFLVDGGANGLMIENFGDAPFYKGEVPREVLAHMTKLTYSIRKRVTVPIGINVLRNDALGALYIAHAAGAQFIRVNVLTGARMTDQGIIEGNAAELIRERKRLDAEHIMVFADINVKHSAPMAIRHLEDDLRDTIERGGADAVIFTGNATGASVDMEELRTAKQIADGIPVLVGSGTTDENIGQLKSVADGFIVGTHLKQDGNPHNPIDPTRVQALVDALRSEN